MAYARATFQELARIRLAEAKLLAENGQSSGAYYLAGYAIECALKAIIAAQFREGEIPDRALVNRVYSHDLAELVRLAGLEADLKAATEEFDGLNQRWSTIKRWSEQCRYMTWSQGDAADMLSAVDGDGDGSGLYGWLTNRW